MAGIWHVPPRGVEGEFHFILLLAAILAFPPTFHAVARGQFSLLILAATFVINDRSRNSYLRGLLLGLSLIKPNCAIPFLLLPLVRREGKVLATAVMFSVWDK